MRKLVVGVVVAVALPVFALAGTIGFGTPPGSQANSENVSADAFFTTGAGTLTITLENLEASIHDAGQLLTDLQFTLSTNDTVATLSTSSGDQIDISKTGGVTDLGSGSTGWGFGNTGTSGNYILCVICGFGVSASATPTLGIVGPGPFTSSDGSIDGNPAHNPFINQSATFTIVDPNITANTKVSNVVFSFSTTFGDNVGGVVPEPRTTVLVAGALGLIVFLVQRRKKTAANA